MILGIDFSLTATGVCAITDGEAECVTVRSKREDSWWLFPERVQGIAQDVARWVHVSDPVLVIESPAFSAKSAALDRMFGGWWLLIDALAREGFDMPLLVTPTQLKKFATGKGNANKTTVAMTVGRRYPDVALANDNEADALVLAAIGAAAHGEPFNGALLKYQEEVVAAVVAGK